MLASTSEVYGDPLEHPQKETYWGNVNPIGPRGVYDEAKRFAEAITLAYHRYHGVNTKIVRIFNTYGPRMRLRDGRAVPAFMSQALRNEDVTVFGDGTQTRSFCYVTDLVDGILRLMEADTNDPVNIGNPHEVTIEEIARTIIRLVGSNEPDRLPAVCRSTIRSSVGPTSPARERCSAGSRRSASKKGLLKTVDYFRRTRRCSPDDRGPPSNSALRSRFIDEPPQLHEVVRRRTASSARARARPSHRRRSTSRRGS